jgi:glutathione synthase/RimK-type ligase-like ATP-grasp enzyme
MAALPRQMLAGPDAAAAVAASGLTFPLLVRVPGFHTGRHFQRVENADLLRAGAASFPGDDAWLIEQLDARDGEGMYRKLRVMFIDRRLYPLHLAISRDWKVHYFRADMADSEKNREVDRNFLDDMAGAIGQRAVAALERISATLDLDYGGIDFAVNAAGEVLLFEANATMVMAPLGPDPKWDYRRPAFDAVFAAIRRMLLERAERRSLASA